MRLPIGIIVLCVVGTHSAEVGQCLEGPECVVGMRNTTRIHLRLARDLHSVFARARMRLVRFMHCQHLHLSQTYPWHQKRL